ncbi:Lrp/AsnC family transcriptional regulator [Kangiella sediminilitoris]|uniref:AsnC family transcriptional regulator n=1 Tax=Kangiella sediminilitoris TaxID=1144748 RepID=A0A1B3BB08_9GAMM|nr:Lrp/AsnC family transcriptional regulator [Kangiella sediminilitoris]AOE49946.1 AsnC family transcriptional regulator [Kangiella sediminilitoris]
MIKSSQGTLDTVDKKILNLLQLEGRLSNSELAKRINLSPPATHARVKRLEQEGFIHQYAALVDRHRLGFDNLCFVEFSLQLHNSEQIQTVLATVKSWPEVLECHNVTGEYDYLLKVAVRNTQSLESFVSEKMIPLEGVARIHTSLVLKEVKTTTAIILED